MSIEKTREVIGETEQGEVCVITMEHNVFAPDGSISHLAERYSVRQGGRTVVETSDGDSARHIAHSLVAAVSDVHDYRPHRSAPEAEAAEAEDLEDDEDESQDEDEPSEDASVEDDTAGSDAQSDEDESTGEAS